MSYYDIDCGCNQATGSQNSVCTIEGDTFYIESSVGVGLSAYEIAVNNGFTGTEEQWLESLKANIPISPIDEGKFLSNDGFSVEWRVVDAESMVITPTPELPEDNVNDALFYLASNKVDKVVGKQLSTEDFTTGYKAKLDGVENDATKNSTDDFLLARENHTGTQSIATIELLQGVLDDKVDKVAGKQLSTEDYTTLEKNKLASIEGGAEVNPSASEIKTLYESNPDTNSFTDVEKTKLFGISEGATTNQTDSYLLARENHTGVQAISTITNLQSELDEKVDKVVGKQLSTEDFTTTLLMKLDGVESGAEVNHTAAEIKSLYESNSNTNVFDDSEKSKLAGIATGATANATNAQLRDRTTHTGEQPVSTITGLQTALDGKVGDTTQVIAGDGLTGGGALSTNRTLTLGLPSTITGSSTNSVTADSHTHSLTITKSDVGLGNVDNTSDMDKPVSSAQQVALDTKVDKVVGKQLTTEDFTTVLKTKLDGIAEGAQVNVATNLGVGTRTTTTVPITSSTGTAATLPAATTALAGVMVSADKTKLDGIAEGATVNQTDAFLLDRVNHTGTQAVSTVTGLQTALDTKVDKVAGKQLSTEDYTSAEKTKLAGIATGATANSTDSFLLDRANHTGTQAASTITGLGVVATSGAAVDVSISDAGNYFTGANVEVALQEVGAMIGDIGSALDLINGEVV